jgi:hypothetical protein
MLKTPALLVLLTTGSQKCMVVGWPPNGITFILHKKSLLAKKFM